MVFPAPGSSARRNRRWGARQQFAVDGVDLVWQRLQVAGGGDRQHRVEKGRVVDAQCLGGQPPGFWVGVEPRAIAGGDDRQAGLAVAAKDDLVRPTVDVAVREGDRVRADPLSLHDCDRTRPGNAEDLGARDQGFQAGLNGRRVARFVPIHVDPRLTAVLRQYRGSLTPVRKTGVLR